MGSTEEPTVSHACMTLGWLPEYQKGDDWEDYVDRLECYMEANNIMEESKKRAILLTVCGTDMYTLMKNLLTPNKPWETSYADLVWVVSLHIHPKRLVVAEHFKFYQCGQLTDESVVQFMAALKCLSQQYAFGSFLDEVLHDHFECGLTSIPVQFKLLCEDGLSSQKVLEMAHGMELAALNATQFHTGVSGEATGSLEGLHINYASQ